MNKIVDGVVVLMTDAEETARNAEVAVAQAEETANGHMYIFNASNSGEYTTATLENSNRDAGGNLMSATGGMGFTVASAVDGIYFFIDASNIVSGEFVLYGIRK